MDVPFPLGSQKGSLDFDPSCQDGRVNLDLEINRRREM
jgi:hypothetical protein